MPVTADAPRRRQKLLMLCNRVSWMVFVALVLVSVVADPYHWAWVFPPAVLAIGLSMVLNRRARVGHSAVERPFTVEVEAPVTGRWLALNSPADKVPSHGTHAYGQTYAIDIVADPAAAAGAIAGSGASSETASPPVARPGFSWFWPLVLPNSAFPAFGTPLLAVADGTVVRAKHGQRDHLSRSSLPMLVYLMLFEGFFREMGGVSKIIGNQVILDLGDGTYALYAHVRRGSITVREGDRVRAGQEIARCGNSGNSTEPHVHFQLMDHPDPDVARGIPFRWRGIGIPANNESFEAGPFTDEGDSKPTAGDRAFRFTVDD
ncbi:M23 family metallopeptidase [Streptomyces albipurpureus]